MRALRSRERRARARSARVEPWKPLTLLRVAVNVVFGAPFLASLAFALRAPLVVAQPQRPGRPDRRPARRCCGRRSRRSACSGSARARCWRPLPGAGYAGALLIVAASALLVGIYS